VPPIAGITLATSYPRWWLLAAAAGGAVVFSVLYLGVGDQIQPRLRRMLQVLRAAAVLVVFGCLAEPMLRTAVPREERRTVAVLVDTSRSMTIPDAGDGEAGERPTRAEVAVGIVGSGGKGIVPTLKRDFNVSTFAFSRGDADGLRPLDLQEEFEATGEKTDLGRALEEVAGRMDRSCAGVILISDGADNSGGRLEALGEKLRSRSVPVYAVGLGASEVTDLAITSISARRQVTRETTVYVEVDVLAAGYAQSDVPVTITRGSTAVARGRARLEAGKGRASLEFVPAREGFSEYTVSVPTLDDEVIKENNRRSFAVDVVKRRLKVLYMEGSQYRRADAKYGFWEHQFLQQALVEDGMEVTALLRDNVEEARKAGIHWVRHFEHGYPRTKKELFKYDVIISSDIDRKFFTDKQLKHTIEFVGRHGGGFCMIGGWTAFGPGGYDESIVDKMLPVDMLGRFEEYVDDVGGEGFKWQLTEEGRVHALMRLVADPVKNEHVWGKMPPFFGYNRIVRAKPAATVLAVHADDENLYGKHVMLAVQPYGRGRSMAFTTDSTAGWGLKFEEDWGESGDNRYFKLFWKKAVRWLAHYRLKAPAKLVLLETDRSLYERGDRLKVSVRVLNSEYEPTHQVETHLGLEFPGGDSRRIELSPDFDRVGYYTAEVPLTKTGRYRVSADAYDSGGELGADSLTVSVVEPVREFTGYAQNRALLEDLAKRTNGRYFTASEAEEIVGELRESTRVVTQYREDSIWDSWVVFALLATVLSVEWLLRKRAGLP